MPQDTYGFGAEEVRRIADVVRRVERLPRTGQQAPTRGVEAAVRPDMVQLVRVSSTTATGGLYPCYVQSYNQASPPGVVDGPVAAWSFAPDGTAPALGLYLARRLAVRAADGLPVYALQGRGLTVEDSSGSPAYADTSIVQVDQTNGLTLANPGTGIAEIGVHAASVSNPGTVTTGAQAVAGDKTFYSGVGIVHATSGAQSAAAKFSGASNGAAQLTVFDQADSNLVTTFEVLQDGAGYHGMLRATDSGGTVLNASYAAMNNSGVVKVGAWATVSGMTFAGGLYVSGTATVSPGTGTGSLVGATSPTMTDVEIDQAANGDTALKLKRATDTSPTGKLIEAENHAGVDVFVVDVTGTVTVGTWQGSVIASSYGGTGSAFFGVAGPTAARTFTFPDASSTVLTDHAAVTVAQGGTGQTSLTVGNVLVGNGTSGVTLAAPGSGGNFLVSQGASSAPSFVTMGGDATVTSAGTVTVAKINGATLGTTTATAGNLLVGSGSQWVSVAMSGGATISSSGVVTVTTMVAAGASHAGGAAPDPGSTAHTNQPYVLTDKATWVAQLGSFVVEPSYVTTSESTASTSPVDLTTAQSLSFSLDNDGADVWVTGFAIASSSVNNGEAFIYATVDGTDYELSCVVCGVATAPYPLAGAVLLTGLGSGSHTAKLRFKVNTGTGTWINRGIAVQRAK